MNQFLVANAWSLLLLFIIIIIIIVIVIIIIIIIIIIIVNLLQSLERAISDALIPSLIGRNCSKACLLYTSDAADE